MITLRPFTEFGRTILFLTPLFTLMMFSFTPQDTHLMASTTLDTIVDSTL